MYTYQLPVVIATRSADYLMRAHNVHTSIRKYDTQCLQVVMALIQ